MFDDSFLTGMTIDSSGALRNLSLVALAVRQEQDFRPFLGDHVAAVAEIARGHEPPDDLAGGRLMALHGAPPIVVEPLAGHVAHVAARLELAAEPELHDR